MQEFACGLLGGAATTREDTFEIHTREINKYSYNCIAPKSLPK
jgi:hypothetical protein